MEVKLLHVYTIVKGAIILLGFQQDKIQGKKPETAAF